MPSDPKGDVLHVDGPTRDAIVEYLRGAARMLSFVHQKKWVHQCADLIEIHFPVSAEPSPQWCPVCKGYHADPGQRTDAGVVLRRCPLLSEDDPRQHYGF
jgi:hypothetical protein